MPELSLQQIFGDNAYQNVDFLVCSKDDFFNLTSVTSNRAESLLVAMLIKAFNNYRSQLTDSEGNIISDSINNRVTYNYISEFTDLKYWKRQYFKGNNQPYLVDIFVLEVYKPYQNGN